MFTPRLARFWSGVAQGPSRGAICVDEVQRACIGAVKPIDRVGVSACSGLSIARAASHFLVDFLVRARSLAGIFLAFSAYALRSPPPHLHRPLPPLVLLLLLLLLRVLLLGQAAPRIHGLPLSLRRLAHGHPARLVASAVAAGFGRGLRQGLRQRGGGARGRGRGQHVDLGQRGRPVARRNEQGHPNRRTKNLITIFTDFSRLLSFSPLRVRESTPECVKKRGSGRLVCQRSFFKFSRLRQTVDFVSTYEYAGVFKNVRRELLCADLNTEKGGCTLCA